MSSMSPSGISVNLFQEMLPGENGKLVSDLLEKQYDLVYGSWPTDYDEIVIVVDENNEIDDMTLYALGLKSKDDIDALAEAAFNKTQVEADAQKWSFEDICGMEFRVVFGADCYTLDESTGLYTDLRETQAGLKYLYDSGMDLKVSGIIRPNEDSVTTMLSSTIGYTSKLTEYVIEQSKDAASIRAQLENPDVDIFTGLPFRENTGDLGDEEKMDAFHTYISELTDEEKAEAYIQIMSIPSDEELDAMVTRAMADQTRETMEETMVQAMASQTGMNSDDMSAYIAAMTDEDIEELFIQMVTEQIKDRKSVV